MNRGAQNSRRGTVLVMVLWILAAIGMLGLSFAAAIRVEIEAARNSVNQRRAYYLTRAGIEYAAYKLLEERAVFMQGRQDGFEDPAEQMAARHFSLSLPTGQVEIDALPENGKLNINRQDPTLVFNVLIMIGLGEEQADIITNSIQDWKDADDVVNEATGAESDYYQTLDPPYQAKNATFSVPEELLLVRGVTPEIYYGVKGLTAEGEPAEFYGLQNYFTTFGGSNRVDVNAAPIQILAAIPGLDYQDALRIDDMRREAPITDTADIMARLPGVASGVMRYLSVERNAMVYTVYAEGRLGENEAASRIRCVIQLGGGPKGYSIFYWNESNMEL